MVSPRVSRSSTSPGHVREPQGMVEIWVARKFGGSIMVVPPSQRRLICIEKVPVLEVHHVWTQLFGIWSVCDLGFACCVWFATSLESELLHIVAPRYSCVSFQPHDMYGIVREKAPRWPRCFGTLIWPMLSKKELSQKPLWQSNIKNVVAVPAAPLQLKASMHIWAHMKTHVYSGEAPSILRVVTLWRGNRIFWGVHHFWTWLAWLAGSGDVSHSQNHHSI